MIFLSNKFALFHCHTLQRKKIRQHVLIFLLFVSMGSFAGEKPSREWLDRKFSMFIHFGLYSVYGGVYDGKPVEWGYSEQIQSFAGIFSDWYACTAQRFDPEKWDPDAIVALAKTAGMQSIVFTSKHHDGFCMYHSRHTDFNIVDATPYKRDLMKELADACRRGGIGFGVYFSLIDWHFPQAYPISSHNADPLTPEHYAYNLKQMEEIMTGYGDISEIWFDMGSLTPEQSKGLYDLVDRLQPRCMISGRLGNDCVDFCVMEDNEYPDYTIGVPWQTAASMFDETWGYRSWQQRGAVCPKMVEKVVSLVKVVSRGGNFLLNIGPRGDGSVVEFERDVLSGIEAWLQLYGEAIYGVSANPFPKAFEWGEITACPDALYLFVKRSFAGKRIVLPGFSGAIAAVTALRTGDPCTYSLLKPEGSGCEIDIPSTTDAGMSYFDPKHEKGQDLSSRGDETPYFVLKLSFRDGFAVHPAEVVPPGVPLLPQHATPLFGHSSLNYYAGYKSIIGYDWIFRTSKGTLQPEILFTDQEKGRVIECAVDGEKQRVRLDPVASKTVKLNPDRVRWGNLYRKPGRGVFGRLEEEGVHFITLPPAETVERDGNANGSQWKKVDDFEYGVTQTEPIAPRQSVVLLQEIESTADQTVAVEITSGNAVYMVLNGRYLTAHFSPSRLKSQTEIILLPLKKGMNQLVIKYYNGYETALSYGIKPLNEWTIYRCKLTPVRLGKEVTHIFALRAAHPESKVAPLRMSNVSVRW